MSAGRGESKSPGPEEGPRPASGVREGDSEELASPYLHLPGDLRGEQALARPWWDMEKCFKQREQHKRQERMH